MKRKFIYKLESLKNSIVDKDEFGENINMNFRGDTRIKTMTGGFCSILQNSTLLFLCAWSLKLIVTFANYDLSQSLLFYDVKELEIDVSKSIEDFAFAFKHDG